MTLRRAPVRTSYFIGANMLEHVEEIKDLGVTLDSKLTFMAHISDVVKRANRSLEMLIGSFQTGSTRSKFDKTALLAAFFASVRSILGYASVVWAGAADSHTVRVDRVQHKFLMWLSHHSSSGTSPSLSYPDLCRHFKVPSLAARRVQHDLLCLRNILTSRLDTPLLLESFLSSCAYPINPEPTPLFRTAGESQHHTARNVLSPAPARKQLSELSRGDC